MEKEFNLLVSRNARYYLYWHQMFYVKNNRRININIIIIMKIFGYRYRNWFADISPGVGCIKEELTLNWKEKGKRTAQIRRISRPVTVPVERERESFNVALFSEG